MILVTVLITIEIPFTDDCLGMPGLSYVRSAAEVSLNIVKPHASTNGLVQKLTRGRLPFLALSTSMQQKAIAKFGARPQRSTGQADETYDDDD